MKTLVDRLSMVLFVIVDRMADALLAVFGEGWE